MVFKRSHLLISKYNLFVETSVDPPFRLLGATVVFCTIRIIKVPLLYQILSSLRGVLAEEANALEDTRVIDNAWRGAEAYHFFLLAQRQLFEGNREGSMRTVCNYKITCCNFKLRTKSLYYAHIHVIVIGLKDWLYKESFY